MPATPEEPGDGRREAGPDIRVEGTPNPNAAKFVLARGLPGEGSRSYFDAASAVDDPLAARLFEIEGVRALLMVENFITVTKGGRLEWPDLLDQIEEAIREALRERDGPAVPPRPPPGA